MNYDNIHLLSSRIQQNTIRNLNKTIQSFSPIQRCETKQLLAQLEAIRWLDSQKNKKQSKIRRNNPYGIYCYNNDIDVSRFKQREYRYEKPETKTVQYSEPRIGIVKLKRNEFLRQSVDLRQLDKLDNVLASDILNRTMRNSQGFDLPKSQRKKTIAKQDTKQDDLIIKNSKSIQIQVDQTLIQNKVIQQLVQESVDKPIQRITRSMRRQRERNPQFSQIQDFKLSKINYQNGWMNNFD